MRILVTGSTGYVGGRLAPRLVEAGHEVRAIVRDPLKLRDAPWAAGAEVVTGDLTDAAAVARAVENIDVVYYLVHAMGAKGDFESTEREAATTVARAAAAAGVTRIVYLGGLHPDVPVEELSKHLRSRELVGRILHLTDVLPYMPRRNGCATSSSRSRSATCCTTSRPRPNCRRT